MEKELRFLSLDIEGYPLFENNLHFSLLTDSRVSQDYADSLMHLFGSNYTNNITTIVGKNATGKTMIMKITMGILSLLFNGKSVKETRLKEVLFDDSDVKFTVYLYGNDKYLYQDQIIIGSKFDGLESNFEVKSEKIFKKKAKVSEPKRDLLTFSKRDLILDRNNLKSDVAAALASDDSMFRMIVRAGNYRVPMITDNTIFTNTNFFIPNLGDVPSEILEYLDPSIEYLKIEKADNNKVFYRLKFKDREEELTDQNFATIEYYLSSGTAKGISLYTQILRTLKSGGIIFVDEIENHFNHAIARSFINYFKDSAININNAKLVFTTHYSEFLDDMDRNDQIFIARRLSKISLTRYSSTKIRSDILRSDVFMSNSIDGTAPEYSAYIALKKATINSIKNYGHRREVCKDEQ